MFPDVNDNLSHEIRGFNLNARAVAWLWFYLIRLQNAKFEDCQLNSETMRDQIAQYIKNNHRLPRVIERTWQKNILPDRSFYWVEKEGRQSRWLVKEAIKNTKTIRPGSLFNRLSSKAQLMLVIDLWDVKLYKKEKELSLLSEDWNSHLQTDKIFKWFRDQDEREKCATAWSWLERNQPLLAFRQKPFLRHNEVIEFFDHTEKSAAEKELIISKIKRQWSTEKSRKNRLDKKQYNFVLTNNTNTLLDELAKTHELSRTKILERLILCEAEQKIYLPTRK